MGRPRRIEIRPALLKPATHLVRDAVGLRQLVTAPLTEDATLGLLDGEPLAPLRARVQIDPRGAAGGRHQGDDRREPCPCAPDQASWVSAATHSEMIS